MSAVPFIRESKSAIDACLVCRHSLDVVAGMDPGPEPGCIVLCAYCGALYLVCDDGEYALIDGQARDELVAANAEVRRALAVRALTIDGLSAEELEAIEQRTGTVDLAELAALAGPVRDELVQARSEVSRLIVAANDLDSTLADRAAARNALRTARSHRDVLRRLLFAVTSYIDAESGEPRE